MRETEERRRLVQQHMANLKRQRLLEAESIRMAEEDALALALVREEKRVLQEQQAHEAAKAKEFRLLKMAADAVTAMEEAVRVRLDAEMETMALEDHRSRQVGHENLAAEAVLRDKEAYLRHLYTSFVPLWRTYWDEGSVLPHLEPEGRSTAPSGKEGGGIGAEEVEVGGSEEGTDTSSLRVSLVGREHGFMDNNRRAEGHSGTNDNDGGGGSEQRPTMWWRGADAPHIWTGPPTPHAAGCRRCVIKNGKVMPGARFVPAERALLDRLEPQAVTVGRLSRKYLALLGLPYESIRDMYQQGSWTVKNGEAMVDGIQLGRVFTMFEKDEVRDYLVPIVPTTERLGKSRQQSSREAGAGRGGGTEGRAACPPPLDGLRSRPQTSAAGEMTNRRYHRDRANNFNTLPPAPRRGILLSLGQDESSVGDAWTKNLYYGQHPNQKDQKKPGGARTAESTIILTGRSNADISGRNHSGRGGSSRKRGSVDSWPGLGWGQQVVRAGVEAIAGLPLSGDKCDDYPTQTTAVLPPNVSPPSVEENVSLLCNQSRGHRRAPMSKWPAPTARNNTCGRQRPQSVGGKKLPTHDHVRGEPGTAAASAAGAMANTLAQVSSRAKVEAPIVTHDDYSAAPPPLVTPAQSPGEVELTVPQWGGFGAGHVPKYFRGKFGIAGKKKLIHRQKGEEFDDVPGGSAGCNKARSSNEGGVPQTKRSVFDVSPDSSIFLRASAVGGVGGGEGLRSSTCNPVVDPPSTDCRISLLSPPPAPKLDPL